MNFKDLTNQKFNRLTVLQRDKNKWNRVMWKCRCDCGNIIFVNTYALKSGSAKSCGCYKSEILGNAMRKHKLSNTRIYNIWKGMRKRCNNPNSSSYYLYGGRGIKVCEEWDKFLPFYYWSMQNGYAENLSIDRINYDGNYEPSNCRWVDSEQQNNNTRQNVFITYNGKTLTLSQWAKYVGLTYSCLKARLYNGWSIEKALTTPVKKR